MSKHGWLSLRDLFTRLEAYTGDRHSQPLALTSASLQEPVRPAPWIRHQNAPDSLSCQEYNQC